MLGEHKILFDGLHDQHRGKTSAHAWACARKNWEEFKSKHFFTKTTLS
jgi:hypothetical protein